MGFQTSLAREDFEGQGYKQAGYWGMDEMALVGGTLEWLDTLEDEPVFVTMLTSTTHDPYLGPGRTAGESPEADHLDALALVDEAFGQLVEGLKERGRLENSLLVVIGDHGEAFGEHRRSYHDLVPFEEVTRVPLILWGPNWVGAPRLDSSLRSIVDLLPTLLDVTGVDWEGELAGSSLLEPQGHEEVITACWMSNSCSTLRRGDTKWVYYFGRRPTKVFDLVADPYEENDIAGSQGPEEVRAVERLLLEHQMAGDLWWESQP